MESVSLKEYLSVVHRAISACVEPDVWVRAEVSELKVNGNGHCYLTLIEKEQSGRMNVCAKASAIIWANVYNMVASMFESVAHQPLQRGMNVLVRVSPNFHEAYGFSLIISDVDPTFTLGDMARKRQEVVDKLKADGVWDMNRELVLPDLPLRIAVISSETAAGFGDFINQLEQNPRQFKFAWRLFPAIMQGADAPASIMNALDQIFEVADQFDVVAIVRGGGASADMLAFDDYELASSCAQFPLPILSGVGHERDTCVVDMVAWQRCKTPTAVGAFLVDRAEMAYTRLCNAQQALADSVRRMLETENKRLEYSAVALSKSVPLTLMAENNKLASLTSALKMSVSSQCQDAKGQLDSVVVAFRSAVKVKLNGAQVQVEAQRKSLQHAVVALLAAQQGKLLLLDQKVNLLSPQSLLKKGYSLTLKNGKIVRSVGDAQPGDVLETLLADGTVKSVVK